MEVGRSGAGAQKEVTCLFIRKGKVRVITTTLFIPEGGKYTNRVKKYTSL